LKAALVTGASRGIGAAVARLLAEDGCRVCLHYHRSGERARQAAEAIRRAGGEEPLLVRADVRSPDDLRAMKETLERAGFRPDIVIHCAGTAWQGMLEDTAETVWDEMMDVHLKAAYFLARLFTPHMIWQRWGRIIHMSSVWGQAGAAGETAYSAAKGGLDSFTKALARELAPSGVTVNAVAPGAVDTDMLCGLTEEDKAELCRSIPLGRLGRPEEVAEVVRFLASEEAGYITGQVVAVTGGWYR
jgi:3-oxoacyl-[acyl-carrier protein] reductase